MRHNTKFRLVISFLFVVGMIILGYYLIFEKWIFLKTILDPNSEEYKIEEIADNNKVQYRLSYTGMGDLKQTIALNAGIAFFKMNHFGLSNFRVELRTNTDSLFSVLADKSGEYSGIVEVNIPTNDAYLLYVKTADRWAIAYK
jgi:hypothetical protein